MLTHLHIRNFAIISQLDVDFGSGLTVVTGETGAGKSIMVDALSLVLGDRAEASVIRTGAEQAEIIASFELIEGSTVHDWLADQSLDAEGDCLMRRLIHREKSSKAFINGRPVTLQMMRELGEQLVDIHGQHAHQALSKRPVQLAILDEFGKLASKAGQVSELWRAWRDLQQQLDALQASENERNDRKALLSYQVQEFDDLGINEQELLTIEADHKRLSHQSELQNTAEKQLYSLYQDDNDSLYSLLNRSLSDLQSLEQMDDSLTPTVELLHGALIQIQEASQSLERYLANLDQDPQAYQQIEQRLGELHQLARKHRLEIQQLMDHYNQLSDELTSLEQSSTESEQLKADTVAAQERWLQSAEDLSAHRHKTASSLEKAVNHYLESLGMQGGRFEVAFETLAPEAANQSGLDRITFMISANPGQPVQPLSKVASGGELSRMSLAIQVVTHSESSIPCLIFDEVDVGIGGGTAEVVGNLLAELAQRAQVLCVTHQAQVAAKGQHHFQVAKASADKQTETRIVKLGSEQRTEEIARMIGGIEITDQTRKFARELLGED